MCSYFATSVNAAATKQPRFHEALAGSGDFGRFATCQSVSTGASAAECCSFAPIIVFFAEKLAFWTFEALVLLHHMKYAYMCIYT